MSEFSFTIDQAAIDALARDATGPVARALEFEAANSIEWDVKDALNVPATFKVARGGRKVYDPNPPVGPPRTRSGDLWASVSHTRPTIVGGGGLHVDVTVRSSHYNFDYPEWLIQQGYVFVNPGNQRYTIVER